jgi:hypothetical protein
MITGRDPQVPADAGQIRAGGPIRAVIALAIALAIGWWVSAGAPV